MEIRVENHLGQSLVLDSLHFPVVNVDGLTPASATINTSSVATVDGTFFNSSYVNNRNIVLTIVPEGNAEESRLTLYRYFKPKYKVRLYFKTKNRNVYIDGYVETFEGALFSNKQSFQISVICPQPFFTDALVKRTEQETAVSAFSFPVALPAAGIPISYVRATSDTVVLNDGEESTGLIIELRAIDPVVEPTVYNRTTSKRFTVQEEMQRGDTITIDTRRGHKTVVLNSEGVETNILNKITQGSSWFEVVQGENIFSFDCVYGNNNLKITYYLSTLYEGV